MKNPKPLQILNASAGSGKTFNLVLTYLQLILSDTRSDETDKNYQEPFAQIMAMTFTNKAALEMKTRIIEALDVLAFPQVKNPVQTQKNEQYIELVAAKIGLSPEKTTERAKAMLKRILHRYEDFHVMTIDKFNLRLIRSFSKDLDLPHDFQIIIHEDEILNQVIDTTLDNLDEKNQRELTQLVLTYSREMLNEGNGWKFENDLRNFAQILKNERHFKALEHLDQQPFSTENYQKLQAELAQKEALIKREALAVFELAEQYDSNDLPGKSKTKNAFNKLTSNELLHSKSAQFFTDHVLSVAEQAKFPADLRDAALRFQAFFEREFPAYLSLRLQRKSFFNMALLQFLNKELESIKRNEQLIRISEFNKLISNLIQNEDAPFIYEKLGTRFHHFLLDEFQDTSRLQWMNMIPLIHESLASGKGNLIVGDPKQSIYRFKNGLAEQFVALPGIYNPDQDPEVARKSAYFDLHGEKLPLADNWRSHTEIVKFNNALFQTFLNSDFLDDEMKTFYADVTQNPKGKAGGYIQITSEKKSEKVDSYALIDQWIDDCLEDGYAPGDICLLGNKREECTDWATHLSNRGFKVVSADSLTVNTDWAVKLTIAYLKWRKNPSGEMEAKQFVEHFYAYKGSQSVQEIMALWEEVESSEGKRYATFRSDRFLAQQFGSETLFFFPYETLYQLVQGFYRLLAIEEEQNPYAHHLSDMMQEFDQTVGPDLDAFLSEYESNGRKSAVQIPENKEAIKIMTGHKSKGLEFPIVMLPSMNWTILRTEIKHLIAVDEHYVHTTISKSSPIPAIQWNHRIEYKQSFLDKLNLCYVMFTRPEERLYIGNYFKENDKFGNILHTILAQQLGVNENTAIQQHIGERSKKDNTLEDPDETTRFVPKKLNDRLWFPDISVQDKSLDEAVILSEERRLGNQLHWLLAHVSASCSFETALQRGIQSGHIERAHAEKLTEWFTAIDRFEPYQALLTNSQEVLREQAILIGPNEIKRPDVILKYEADYMVLDYKTGMRKGSDSKQVASYVRALRSMGLPASKGIVFYTDALEFVEIEV